MLLLAEMLNATLAGFRKAFFAMLSMLSNYASFFGLAKKEGPMANGLKLWCQAA
jgi:hypothetical protein